MAEESELENMSIETSQIETQREKRIKTPEQNTKELWDNYKRCNTCNGNTRTEEIFEVIMSEYFPKLMEDTETEGPCDFD